MTLAVLLLISSARASDACAGKIPDATAKQTMLECTDKLLSKQSGNALAGMVDVDQKVMFVIDRATGEIKDCADVSTGKGTGDQYGQTPTGVMITEPHHGGKYDSRDQGRESDCVGLKGTDAETREREANGVVLHKAHGRSGRNSTLGCIGVDDAKFDEVKKLLYGSDGDPKKSALFIFTKDTREQCGHGGGRGRLPASAPGPQAESIQ